MNSKPITRPVYRLTLKHDAVAALSRAKKKPFRFVPLGMRPDYGADLGITISIADQLMTFAKAGENLSDTLVRLLSLPAYA